MRPFGEHVAGKIVVRDSVGASRAWEDFGVKFRDLGEIVESAHAVREKKVSSSFGTLEENLEQQIRHEGVDGSASSFPNTLTKRDAAPASPLYELFLKRLISGSPMTAHETFQHPVTCVIAISSQNPSPIESLRQLYGQTSQGSRVLPSWASSEYLRYYVLVHDEDHDDLAKSSALFDQMKRHFGLHCHLLRIRGTAASRSDTDAVPLAHIEWLSPTEDLQHLRGSDNLIEVERKESYIFESDSTAIKTFVRELVAQSIVPHMENRIALWNDQVASKRKGISGRFMSISKRWAGFGSSRTSSPSGSMGGSGGNYDSLQGHYTSETPEAVLRKMADYSFMLRDFKLAASTYDLLRSDYNNDKAWKYLAGANEMCVISNLLNPLATASRLKVENLDQMLETSAYSYLTRCADPHSGLRCLALAVELLRVRSRSMAQLSSKWAIRIIEAGLLGAVGHVLVSERVAACFMSHTALSNAGWGTRQRKAAFWYVMAADAWSQLGNMTFATSSLEQADWLYRNASRSENILPYPEMQQFLEQLQLGVKSKATMHENPQTAGGDNDEEALEPEETSEKLDTRRHRRSLIAPATHAFDMGPLSPTKLPATEEQRPDDDFE